MCRAYHAPGMAAVLQGYAWSRDTVGESGAAVYRLHRPGTPDLFLKHGRGGVADDVIDEMVRLRWLVDRVAVPAVRHFAATPEEAWLLTTSLPGATAWQLLDAAPPGARPAIVDRLVAFLRRLHAIPTAYCPFVADHPFRLARARVRIDAGLVDEEDFDEERQGWSAGRVWAAMHRLLPFAPDPVVTHGDYSLDNLLIADGAVTGCIDVGRVGIADRYQDIAIMWHCRAEFDSALQDRFVARYGIARLDRRKLDFHLMLDEMF